MIITFDTESREENEALWQLLIKIGVPKDKLRISDDSEFGIDIDAEGLDTTLINAIFAEATTDNVFTGLNS